MDRSQRTCHICHGYVLMFIVDVVHKTSPAACTLQTELYVKVTFSAGDIHQPRQRREIMLADGLIFIRHGSQNVKLIFSYLSSIFINFYVCGLVLFFSFFWWFLTSELTNKKEKNVLNC